MDRARLDLVLQQTSTIGLIGEYTRLTRYGERWIGSCPLHRDQDHSLFVDESRGLYFCFGCESKGNAVGFLQQIEGLSLDEAVQRLERRMTEW